MSSTETPVRPSCGMSKGPGAELRRMWGIEESDEFDQAGKFDKDEERRFFVGDVQEESKRSDEERKRDWDEE